MRQSILRTVLWLAIIAALTLNFSQPATAQSTWQKMKQKVLQQECQSGNQKACQDLAKLNQQISGQGQTGQTQSPAQPQAQPSSSQPAHPDTSQQPTGGTVQSGSPASDANCCTPEAMKKVAESLGFVDIVGIKLGMTPKEAVAAVKAHNPSLKIETLTARLEHPSGPPGNFVRVPMTIKAYTANLRQDIGPVEWIAMRFTLPPGPPLLAEVQRYTGFVISQPVMNANLIQSLRQKYGQDNYRVAGMAWVYDNGKLLPRVSNAQAPCVGGSGGAGDVPGGGPGPIDGGETGVGINLDLTDDSRQPVPEAGPNCVPLVWVRAGGVGEDYAPNSQQTSMTVTLESGALMYMSRQATHAWLKAEADAKMKKDEKAAAERSAPTL